MKLSCNLLIVGASVRAAAFSAMRAGLLPQCADLFADRDLQEHCSVSRIPGRFYPGRLVEFLHDAPDVPWMYTGGLENSPDVVEEMAACRPLWGNDRRTLLTARSPWKVGLVLSNAGFLCPELLCPEHTVGEWAARRWLLKSVHSTGGSGVSWWDEKQSTPRDSILRYLQEYVEGESCAALFVGDGNGVRFLGLTRQLVGESWLHARPFHYCGTIGPLPIDDDLRRECHWLGAVLARECGLRGVFGVDGIVRRNTFWPVEVNPRYTSSVEVMELALGESVLASHVQVFDPTFVARLPFPGPNQNGIIGKAILFARERVAFPEDGPWNAGLGGPLGLRPYADIPQPMARIQKGRPILTIFCDALSVDECLASLRQKTADLEKVLYGPL